MQYYCIDHLILYTYYGVTCNLIFVIAISDYTVQQHGIRVKTENLITCCEDQCGIYFVLIITTVIYS